jgi:hypothetical protein
MQCCQVHTRLYKGGRKTSIKTCGRGVAGEKEKSALFAIQAVQGPVPKHFRLNEENRVCLNPLEAINQNEGLLMLPMPNQAVKNFKLYTLGVGIEMAWWPHFIASAAASMEGNQKQPGWKTDLFGCHGVEGLMKNDSC